MDLSDHTIVLTGASSGIGRCAALQFAQAGAAVCLVARRVDELLTLKAEIEAEGAKAWAYPADLSDPAAVDALSANLLAEHPRIDVLINNAARSIRRPIADSFERLHDYERTMQLNYFGAVRLTMKLLPRMIEQGRGHIIISTSMSTLIPIPLFSAYLASKAALESFGRSLAAELGERGIAVTSLHFPMVRTPMTAPTKVYKHLPMMSAEKAAGWMLDAVQRRPARITTPLARAWGLATIAMPGVVTRASQLAFKAMDYALKKRLDKD